MRRTRSYSRPTLELAKVLGLEIARNDLLTPSEIGRLVGIQFFGAEPGTEQQHVDRARERLALLPARVRAPVEDYDDGF